MITTTTRDGLLIIIQKTRNSGRNTKQDSIVELEAVITARKGGLGPVDSTDSTIVQYECGLADVSCEKDLYHREEYPAQMERKRIIGEKRLEEI